ncbi:mammalian cell entry protein [Mycobacterium sp.]|uniref:mammalian cell entry protein n=1 Tax=Mycobacterium sp. TaxID=1785 RepID=UPI003A8715B5
MQRVRRRASREAGPPTAEPNGHVAADTRTATVVSAPVDDKSASKKNNLPSTVRPPRRRQPNSRLAGRLGAAAVGLAIAVLAAGVGSLAVQHRAAERRQAREQRFVDTAAQTVVNMFTHTQDNIDEAVNRFVDGTSGPLRSKFGPENVEFLKGLFRKTDATSEAVINGAALESVDPVSDNAAVLVAVRVTVADIDGVNKPSMPYRLRVIVHEDESGTMTGYDLMYPDGGN